MFLVVCVCQLMDLILDIASSGLAEFLEFVERFNTQLFTVLSSNAVVAAVDCERDGGLLLYCQPSFRASPVSERTIFSSTVVGFK